MRAENASMIDIARSGKLGPLNGFRYFLSIGLEPSFRPTAIQEAVHLCTESTGEDLPYLLASADEQRDNLLITGFTASGVLVNLMFHFGPDNGVPIKQVEICGKDGMYQFDTATEGAFYSDFDGVRLSLSYSEPDSTAIELYNKVLESIETNEKVTLGGEAS